MAPQDVSKLPLSIAAVERDTGLSKDLLRVWERRYGFPAPRRDAAGVRVYSADDIERLRLLKRLIDVGYRPGKILDQPPEKLQELAAKSLDSLEIRGEGPDVQALLDLLLRHRVEELRRQLSQSLLRMGLAQFVARVVAPLNVRIGDAWSRGALEVFEEHLYTESIQGLLRNAISGIPRPGVNPPLVLLTTFPREPHGLGLLMAEAFFALEGCRCISLGVQTPIQDIARAAEKQQVQIVALSFSHSAHANQSMTGLSDLRRLLSPEIEIWVGGNCPILERRTMRGVVRVRQLTSVGAELLRWRKRRVLGRPIV